LKNWWSLVLSKKKYIWSFFSIGQGPSKLWGPVSRKVEGPGGRRTQIRIPRERYYHGAFCLGARSIISPERQNIISLNFIWRRGNGTSFETYGSAFLMRSAHGLVEKNLLFTVQYLFCRRDECLAWCWTPKFRQLCQIWTNCFFF
jgi:hypothetical protein